MFFAKENTPLSLHFSSAPSSFLPLRMSTVSPACFPPSCGSSSGSSKCSLPMVCFFFFLPTVERSGKGTPGCESQLCCSSLDGPGQLLTKVSVASSVN